MTTMAERTDTAGDAGTLDEGAGTAAGLADRVLARSADAVFVLDPETGRAAHRWYDPARSKLVLPATPGEQQLVSWVHPDDLPQILHAHAEAVNGVASRSAFARINPDKPSEPGSTLLVSFRGIDEIKAGALLVQVWVIGTDSVVHPDLDGKESLSSLAAAAPVGLQVVSAVGRVSFENERFTELAGNGRERIAEIVAECVARERDPGREHMEDLAIGARSLRLRVVPTLHETGHVVHVVVSLEDMTQVAEAEAGRALAEEQFDALFDGSPLATALVSVDGEFVRANEAFGIVVGREPGALVGVSYRDVTHPDDIAADEELRAEVLSGARSNFQMEKRYLHAAGHEIWIELTVAPVRGVDGAIRNLVVHAEDITSRRSMIDFGRDDDAGVGAGGGDADGDGRAVGSDLEYWATHDHLTNLPNRRALELHLSRSLVGSRRSVDRPVVMFLDLDDFKPVNDALGHAAGDEVLRATARRLRSACREDALVARYGGDEFVVVARRLRHVAEIPLLVDRIQTAVRAPMLVADTTVRIGASLGIAVAHEHDTVESVLARADAAAYRAKAAGKNGVYFDAKPGV